MREEVVTVPTKEEELDKDISFELSKERRIETKIKFEWGGAIKKIIGQLIKKINRLETQVEALEEKSAVSKRVVSKESLIRFWSNKSDRKWDQVLSKEE